MPVITARKLTRIGTTMFVAAGASTEEAKLVSNLLVKSNLAGHDSHGVIRIIQYIEAIEQCKIKPCTKLQIVQETPSSALLDGNFCFGQVVAKKAIELAIEKAKRNTVGVVGAYNLYHIGRLADYTMIAAQNDMIGLAMANSRKGVAPYGGREKLLGTNPVSYAFPTLKQNPFVLDIATSVCAEGKIRVKLHKGEVVPDGFIIDKNGKSTNNPVDFYNGGAILPLGGDQVGYKGFGLALVVEVLSGILSRSGCGYKPEKYGNGIFFQAINIESFLPIDEFKRQIDEFIQKVKFSKLRPGFKEIIMPGEPELRTEQKRYKQGIHIPEKTWVDIQKMAKRYSIPTSKLLDSE